MLTCGMTTLETDASEGVEKVHCGCSIDTESNDRGT